MREFEQSRPVATCLQVKQMKSTSCSVGLRPTSQVGCCSRAARLLRFGLPRIACKFQQRPQNRRPVRKLERVLGNPTTTAAVEWWRAYLYVLVLAKWKLEIASIAAKQHEQAPPRIALAWLGSTRLGHSKICLTLC